MVRFQPAIRQGSTTKISPNVGNMFSPDNLISVPGNNRAYWALSNPIFIPSDTVFDRIQPLMTFTWPKALVGSFTMKLSRIKWQTVADPRPAWGYPTS
jgi:hypothetical protein